jgi:tRNA (cytidine/uridine-2'-O-)-methyltransferase
MSREIAQGAAQGQSFAEQLARYPQLVPSYVRGMLLAGEKAGALPRVCQELAEELRQQQKARWAAAIAQLWLSIIFLLGLFVAGLPRLINPEHVDLATYRQYLAHIAFPVLICVFVLWLGARLIGALPWLAVPLHVIGPLGFPMGDRRIREAALDYGVHLEPVLHLDADAFCAWYAAERRRLVLLSTKARLPYHRAAFRPGDLLLVGNERRGVPDWLQARAELAVRVPMAPARRALNLVVAGAIVLGEAMRQTGAFDRLAGLEPASAGAGER